MQYTQLSRRSASSKIDWEKQYLTFIPVEDAVFSWAERAVSGHLEYSVNGGQTWVTIANGESTPTITTGSKVIWRGDLKPNISNNYGIGTFSSTANYHAKGNTMSLLYSDDFYSKQLDISGGGHEFERLFYNNTHILSAPLLPATILSVYCYYEMFKGCTGLTTAPELPATTMTNLCYGFMFANCTSLTTAPELPAMTLGINCYSSMFRGCKSLTTAPELPAMTLASTCYHDMFSGCTSLTTAPELPATTLEIACYYSMFYGCTKLNYIKCLATNISAPNCLIGWVFNVASTGTFVKKPNMSSWPTGASGIPSGWTIVDNN